MKVLMKLFFSGAVVTFAAALVLAMFGMRFWADVERWDRLENLAMVFLGFSVFFCSLGLLICIW